MTNYSKQWSTATPGYLIFLIDQSSSMGNEWENGNTFAEFTADVINRTISELIATNAAGEKVKNRVFVSLIGYGGDTVTNVKSGYLSDYADSPLRIERKTKLVKDGQGGHLEMKMDVPVFLEPKASGLTPMYGAFEFAEQLISSWVEAKQDCPVPVVINISDGRPDGGSDEATTSQIVHTIAKVGEIMSLETLDGNPLVFNIHISKRSVGVQFPVTQSEVAENAMASLLFRISSRVPDVYKRAAKDLQLGDLRPNCKGFISNASPEMLIKFINFGSSGGLNRITF